MTLVPVHAQTVAPAQLTTFQLRYLRYILLTIGNETTSDAKGLASFEKSLVVGLHLTPQDLSVIRSAAHTVASIPSVTPKAERENLIAAQAAVVMAGVQADAADRIVRHCAVIQQLDSTRIGGN